MTICGYNKKTASAKENKVLSTQQPEYLDIYLFIGQSNMAGRANIEEQDKDSLENVFLFTGIENNEWEKAANPLNKYSTFRKKIEMQKLGPGYTFAHEMVKSEYSNKIGLVVNAKGGTKIEQWAPGTAFYNEAVNRTKEALKYGTLKGIVWHQGEANASKHETYTPKIIELIKAFIAEFGNPDLPFVAGQLSKDKPHRKSFNKMILQLPRHIDNCGVIKTKRTSTIDNTHFDSKSQRKLGKRYAREMLELLEKK